MLKPEERFLEDIGSTINTIKRFNEATPFWLAIELIKLELFSGCPTQESSNYIKDERNNEEIFIKDISRILADLWIKAELIDINQDLTISDFSTQGSKKMPCKKFIFSIIDNALFANMLNDPFYKESWEIELLLHLIADQIKKYAYNIDFTFSGDEFKKKQTRNNVISILKELSPSASEINWKLKEVVSAHKENALQEFILWEKYISNKKGALTKVNLRRPEFGWLTSDWNKTMTTLRFIVINLWSNHKYSKIYQKLILWYMDDLERFFKENYPITVKYIQDNKPKWSWITLEDNWINTLIFLEKTLPKIKSNMKELYPPN